MSVAFSFIRLPCSDSVGIVRFARFSCRQSEFLVGGQCRSSVKESKACAVSEIVNL